MFDSLLDWAASKVQNFTGESDRRRLVEEFKQTHSEYKFIISEIVSKINTAIELFNTKIENLNDFRKTNVKKNIVFLGVFLSQFGNLEKVGDYAIEEKQEQVEMPQKQFELAENYIEDIDWSKDDVFNKSFYKTLLGVREETRGVNKETTVKINDFKMQGDETIRIAENKNDFVNQDIQILDIYQDSVKSISSTIEEKIIPEMKLVQAFLQCDEIKNCILANKEIQVKTQNEISLLAGTKYNKHYQFIKNTFMFFIISSKIYNTPVLSNLLNNEKHDEEQKVVTKYGEILKSQQNKLDEYVIR